MFGVQFAILLEDPPARSSPVDLLLRSNPVEPWKNCRKTETAGRKPKSCECLGSIECLDREFAAASTLAAEWFSFKNSASSFKIYALMRVLLGFFLKKLSKKFLKKKVERKFALMNSFFAFLKTHSLLYAGIRCGILCNCSDFGWNGWDSGKVDETWLRLDWDSTETRLRLLANSTGLCQTHWQAAHSVQQEIIYSCLPLVTIMKFFSN